MTWTRQDDEQFAQMLAPYERAAAFASRWMLARFGTDKLDRDMTAEELGELCEDFTHDLR